MIFRCAGSGSDGNCYSLTDSKGKTLLIEAGLPYKKIEKFLDYNITNLEGCIVTHQHLDHVMSAPKLHQKGTKTFRPFELDVQERVVKYGDYRIKAFELMNSERKSLHTNGDGTECQIFGFYIFHPEMGQMVYLTDCEYCPYVFRKTKIEHFLLGVNYQEEYAPMDDAKKAHVLSGHMSERTAIEFLKASQTNALQTVILGHLSEESCKPDELLANVKKAVVTGAEVHIAVPGMELELHKDCPFG